MHSLTRAASLAAVACLPLLAACGKDSPNSPGDPTKYNITLRFYGTALTEPQRALFEAAAARIEEIIVADLPAVHMNDTLTGCSEQIINELVDDVIIYISQAAIDGNAKVLASAGPCFIRNTGEQPVVGIMTFDSADLPGLTADGSLDDVILHEMLHVVGIGSIWEIKDLLTGAGEADPRYTGNRARTECQSLGGATTCATSVPVENVGGEGSADAHWRESVFNTELMTSSAEASTVAMPLSRITIGALEDLGYTVNFAQADVYSLLTAVMADGGAFARLGPPAQWERRGPSVIRRVDALGRVTGTSVRR